MNDGTISDIEGIEDVQYDSQTDTYSITLDPAAVDDIGGMIARTVAAVSDSYLGDFPPIADAIDPDSLEELFEFGQSIDDRSWRCLTFEFVTRRVSLYSDGSLVLEPIDATDPGP